MNFKENFGLKLIVHVLVAVAVWVGVAWLLSTVFFHEPYTIDQWDILAPILIVIFVDGLGLTIDFGGKNKKE